MDQALTITFAVYALARGERNIPDACQGRQKAMQMEAPKLQGIKQPEKIGGFLVGQLISCQSIAQFVVKNESCNRRKQAGLKRLCDTGLCQPNGETTHVHAHGEGFQFAQFTGALDVKMLAQARPRHQP